MRETIIQQGAEAVLIKKEMSAAQLLADSRFAPSARNSNDSLRSPASHEVVLKRRVKKNYRLEILDEKLRKTRTKKEAKILQKVSKLIPTPRVLKIDEKNFEIEMEFLDGDKMSEVLDDLKNWKEVCFEIGKNIAAIHDVDVIHGDLTTSNMILIDGKEEVARELLADSRFAPSARNSKSSLRSLTRASKVYFIDYGLGFENGKIEDKAVDLHLIKQALEAKHFSNAENFFAEILKGYKKSKNYKLVMDRFEKVEKRGRYKAQY